MQLIQYHLSQIQNHLKLGGELPLMSYWAGFISLFIALLLLSQIIFYFRHKTQSLSSVALLTGIMGAVVLTGNLFFNLEAGQTLAASNFLLTMQTAFALAVLGGLVAIFLVFIEKLYFGPDPVLGLRRTITDIQALLRQHQSELSRLLTQNKHSHDPEKQQTHKALVHISQQIYDLTQIIETHQTKTQELLDQSLTATRAAIASQSFQKNSSQQSEPLHSTTTPATETRVTSDYPQTKHPDQTTPQAVKIAAETRSDSSNTQSPSQSPSQSSTSRISKRFKSLDELEPKVPARSSE